MSHTSIHHADLSVKFHENLMIKSVEVVCITKLGRQT